MNKRAEIPLQEQISFRVSKQVYDDLISFARTKKGIQGANSAARWIIQEFLSPQNENILQKAQENVFSEIRLVDLKMEYFIELFKFYLINHFSSHKKVPPELAENTAKESEQRYQNFMNVFNTEVFHKNPGMMETFFANFMEEKPTPKK
jgi:hypothetical protein